MLWKHKHLQVFMCVRRCASCELRTLFQPWLIKVLCFLLFFSLITRWDISKSRKGIYQRFCAESDISYFRTCSKKFSPSSTKRSSLSFIHLVHPRGRVVSLGTAVLWELLRPLVQQPISLCDLHTHSWKGCATFSLPFCGYESKCISSSFSFLKG